MSDNLIISRIAKRKKKHPGKEATMKKVKQSQAPLLVLQVYCSTCLSELHRHMGVFLFLALAANNAEIYTDKMLAYRISSSSSSHMDAFSAVKFHGGLLFLGFTQTCMALAATVQ